MTNMKSNFHLPSVRSFFCLKAPAAKDTENAKKEEGQGAASASAFSSRNKMPGNRPPGWFKKEFEKSHAPKKEPDVHIQWEENSLLVTPERGDALLRNLKLEKENYGSGAKGKISTYKNESGEMIAGKFPHSRGKDDKDEMDVIAGELEVYKTIYQKAGHHRNLLNVYGIAKVPDTNGNFKHALLMEKIQGATGWDTFAALRKSRDAKKISRSEYWEAIQFIGRRLLDVIEHVSKAGVVHGDIKPQNFLVNEETGEPVLIDFGNAGLVGDFVRDHTILYTPPEYFRGENLGVQGDMFSAVASLLHCINPEMKQQPRFGLMDQRVPVEDDEGNPIVHKPGTPGTDAVETAYIKFMDKLLAEDVSSRGTIDEAKKLDFLKNSMLDDDAAKKIIIKVIKKANELTSMEEEKTAETQGNLAEP